MHEHPHLGRDVRVIHKVILSSPCLWASFHPLSPPSFHGICKSNEILIKSQYETQHRMHKIQDLIIVLVQQARAMKGKKRKRQDETQFNTKVDGFLRLKIPWVKDPSSIS
jgi:hypothetical protein